jgi:hypothetical protein
MRGVLCLLCLIVRVCKNKKKVTRYMYDYKRRSRATINEFPTFALSTTEGST